MQNHTQICMHVLYTCYIHVIYNLCIVYTMFGYILDTCQIHAVYMLYICIDMPLWAHRVARGVPPRGRTNDRLHGCSCSLGRTEDPLHGCRTRLDARRAPLHGQKLPLSAVTSTSIELKLPTLTGGERFPRPSS